MEINIVNDISMSCEAMIRLALSYIIDISLAREKNSFVYRKTEQTKIPVKDQNKTEKKMTMEEQDEKRKKKPQNWTIVVVSGKLKW